MDTTDRELETGFGRMRLKLWVTARSLTILRFSSDFARHCIRVESFGLDNNVFHQFYTPLCARFNKGTASATRYRYSQSQESLLLAWGWVLFGPLGYDVTSAQNYSIAHLSRLHSHHQRPQNLKLNLRITLALTLSKS